MPQAQAAKAADEKPNQFVVANRIAVPTGKQGEKDFFPGQIVTEDDLGKRELAAFLKNEDIAPVEAQDSEGDS